jgi:hypothetical protein
MKLKQIPIPNYNDSCRFLYRQGKHTYIVLNPKQKEEQEADLLSQKYKHIETIDFNLDVKRIKELFQDSNSNAFEKMKSVYNLLLNDSDVDMTCNFCNTICKNKKIHRIIEYRCPKCKKMNQVSPLFQSNQ